MILYADDIVLLCESIDELAEIVNIYDKTFARYVLTILTNKTETMAFRGNQEYTFSDLYWSYRAEKIAYL